MLKKPIPPSCTIQSDRPRSSRNRRRAKAVWIIHAPRMFVLFSRRANALFSLIHIYKAHQDGYMPPTVAASMRLGFAYSINSPESHSISYMLLPMHWSHKPRISSYSPFNTSPHSSHVAHILPLLYTGLLTIVAPMNNTEHWYP